MNLVSAIISFFYIIIVLMYIIISLFILYHLKRYSFYFRSQNFILAFFAIGSAFLLVVSLSLFLSIDWPGLFASLMA